MEANTPKDPGEEVKSFIRKNYRLNPKNGAIFSLIAKRFIGSNSDGCPVHDGYRRIRIGERTLKYAHIVFFLHTGRWPRHQLDHKDHNKRNNAPWNLEEVTNEENQKRRNLNLKKRREMAHA